MICNLKRPLGSSKHRWDNNIKNDLPKLRWEKEIDLAEERDQW